MSKRIPDAALFSVTEKLPHAVPAPTGAPDVTVVTVVYNAVRAGRAQSLKACLDSVQVQRGCRVEHLIVDGGSDDGTMEIVSGYANKSVLIRYVSKPDRGLYEAMNRGIALARGRCVAFLNSDDRYIRSDALGVSIAAIALRQADFSYAPTAVIDDWGRPRDHDFSHADEFRALVHNMEICHQTVLVRREALLEADGFDLAYRSAADYDLLLRLVYADRCGVRVETPFVEFRSGGFSTQNSELSEREVDRIFQSRLKERFGLEVPCEAVRCMRQNLSYPPSVFEGIRQIGERVFRRKLLSAEPERNIWRAAMAWRWDERFPKAVWGMFSCASLPDGRLKDVLQCGYFAVRHPLHALGAIKAWIVHRKDERLPLQRWFEIRCDLMIRRRLPSIPILPCDDALADSTRTRSNWGLVCNGSVAVDASSVRAERGRLFVLLYPFSYRKGELMNVDVLLGGRRLGSVSLANAAGERWGVFRFPSVRGNQTIELAPSGDGRFVFGGLCRCLV